VCRRKVEDALCDAARDVEEHEVFDPAGGAAHGTSEEPQDLPGRARAPLDDPEEVVARDRHDLSLVECGHRGRSRGIVEERELAEHRAVALDGDDDLVSVVIRNRDLHRTRRDHVEMAPRVIAVEDDLVACKATRSDMRRDLFTFRIRQRAEDRHTFQDPRDRVGVHGFGNDTLGTVSGAALTTREGWVERDGVRLHYVEWPGDSGAAVFALHGLSSNARFWTRVASRLPGRRFVALDQRSHGRSDPMRSGDTLATFIDDSRHAISTLGLDRPVLVGHSWGASIALELAARHPDTVSALGFIDGPAWPLSETLTWPEFAARSQTALPRHSDLSAAIAAARASHGPLWGEDLVEFVHAGHRSEGDAVVMTLTHEARASILRDLFDLRQDQAWKSLAVPAFAAFALRKSDVVLAATKRAVEHIAAL
jgi:pimeloyl-ACP methyl ester carboxylesterase